MSCASLRWCACLSAAVALLAPVAVRAEAPVNPLRVRARISDAPTDAVDIWQEPADGPPQPLAIAAEPVPAAPKSIVPRELAAAPPESQAIWGPEPHGQPHPYGPGGEMGHDSLVQPWFTHTDPNDPFRHSGAGRPLIGTSWLNRPCSFGVFLGGHLADDPIADRVLASNSFFLGGRLGWDFDHYWGLEGRYAFSHPQLVDSDDNTLPDRAREYFVDVSLAYYPWGDSQWRPFFSAGLGFQTFRFHDDTDEQISQSLLSVPLGVGLKFFHSPCWTLRLEAYDNIAFGDGRLSGMHNFTLAAGAEVRFGGRPTSYFPWHSGTAHW
jgi:hypothetical protein